MVLVTDGTSCGYAPLVNGADGMGANPPVPRSDGADGGVNLTEPRTDGAATGTSRPVPRSGGAVMGANRPVPRLNGADGGMNVTEPGSDGIGGIGVNLGADGDVEPRLGNNATLDCRAPV